MTNTTTLNETLRSPLDYTEDVRLATPGANWRTPLSALATVGTMPINSGTDKSVLFQGSGANSGKLEEDAQFNYDPGDQGHLIVGTTNLSVFQTFGQFPGAGNPSLGIVGGTTADYQFTVQIVSQWTEGLNIGMKAYPAQPAYWNLWCVPPSTPASAPQWDGLHLLGINWVGPYPADKNPIVFDENANTYFCEGSIFLVPDLVSSPSFEISIDAVNSALEISSPYVNTIFHLVNTSGAFGGTVDEWLFGAGGNETFFYYNVTQDVTPFALKIQVGGPGAQFQLSANGVLNWSDNARYAGLGTVDLGLSRISAGLSAVGNGTVGDFSGSMKMTDIYTDDPTFLHRTTQSLTNNAAANTATLTNAPAAGNPTKWIAIDDNGTTRYIPTW